jgi:hypothetical protein
MELTKESVLYAKCFCQKAYVTLKGPPPRAHYCHCNMCQIIHGAPFALVAIYPKHQVVLPDNHVELFDTFEPKKNLIIHRCKECGVPLFSWTGNYDVWGVYVSAAITHQGKQVKTRDFPAFEGVCHIFYEERQRDVKYYLRWVLLMLGMGLRSG